MLGCEIYNHLMEDILTPYMVDSHQSSSIKVLGVSDGPKINIAISTNL